MQNLIISNQTKIVMLIMDGLVGYPRPPGGKVKIGNPPVPPELDVFAKRASSGLTVPVG